MSNKTIRVQLDLDKERHKQLLALERRTGSVSHSEAVRRIIDLAGYLETQLASGKPIDHDALKKLFFVHLKVE